MDFVSVRIFYDIDVDILLHCQSVTDSLMSGIGGTKLTTVANLSQPQLSQIKGNMITNTVLVSVWLFRSGVSKLFSSRAELLHFGVEGHFSFGCS